MYKLVSLALVALAAVSAVHGSPIVARTTPPKGWIAEILESYDAYHTRYLAIGCQNKHNTQFFDDCCHPMKKGETLEKNRKAYCRPGADPAPSSTLATLAQPPASSPAPAPTPVPGNDDCEDDGDDYDYDDGDDDDDDDEEDCEEEPVPSPVPSYTPAPVPTSSSKPPNPTPSPEPPKPTSTSDTPKPSPTPPANNPSETHTGGHVTWYRQNGNYGACGNKRSDDDFIAALDYRAYGNLGAKSKYCGQKIRVSWQGKSVDVVVEDACPSCANSASVDLSVAAFKALAPLDVGQLTGVTWELL
jgi:hypothetical protein